MSVYKILQQLAATSSRNEKEAILKANADNELLKRVISYALDPFRIFYMRKVPKYPPNSWTIGLEAGLTSLDVLSTRQVTGHAAQAHVINLLSNMDEPDADVIKRVIEKDLRCGVSEGTVNKVWKKLIPEWPCMLASGFEQKLVDQMTWPAIAQVKMDGMRFNAVYRETIEYFSRNGKPLGIMETLDEDVAAIFKFLLGHMVLDGELWVADQDGKPLPRKTSNGILTKAIKGTISKSECDRIHATVWDIVPYNNFFEGKSWARPYTERLADLKMLIAQEKPQRIHLIETHIVADQQQAEDLFRRMLEKDEEGIILKDEASPWEDKRSKHHVKFKAEMECDLLCIGWEKGTGKNLERLGALNLQSADGVIKVSVGSGFTDFDRDNLTEAETIGKIVTIKYNGRIVDKKTQVESLFLPVFLEVRDDKSEADTSQSIK